NGPASHHVKADIAVALKASVDGIILPKLETTADLQMFEGSTPIIGIVETARGVANVEVLVNEERGCLTGLAFGAEDYSAAMRKSDDNSAMAAKCASRRARLKWQMKCSRLLPKK